MNKKRNLIVVILLAIVILLPLAGIRAQTTASDNVDIYDKGFKFVVCDGPPLPKTGVTIPAGYVPCDFNGAMLQVQHLINILIVFGIVAAMVMMTYAGGLMLTGNPKHISTAKGMFPKIFWGLIIMLTAWFMVYQLLSWVTKTPGDTNEPSGAVLLGKPKQ